MAEITEIFPVDNSIINTKINLFDEKTEIKILGSDVIIQTPEENLVIIYGAVFTSLGNQITLKDGAGNEISLENLLYSPKIQFKKSIDFDQTKETDELLLIKDKDETLVGQETTAEQEEVTEYINIKYFQEEVNEIIEEAIEKIKNSKEETQSQVDKLATAEPLKFEYPDPPQEEQIVPEVTEGLTQNTETRTEAEVESSQSALLEPIWEIVEAGSDTSINIINDLAIADNEVDLINTQTFDILGKTGSDIQIEYEISQSNNTILTGTTITDADGNWRFSITDLDNTNNEDFQISVTVISAESGENITNIKGLKIDTTNPSSNVNLDANTNTGTDSDNITFEPQPTLTGTTEAGANIVISQNDIEIGRTDADELGSWLFTIPVDLNEGDNEFTITVTDIAGNPSSTTQTITLDTTAPNSDFSLTPVTDNGRSNSDNLTNDATPTLTGTTEVGASVIISQGDIEIGSTTANDLGVWRFDIPATDMSGSPFVLQEGANIMTANVVDIAGNSSRSSQTITLDTTAPNSDFSLTPATDSGRSNSDNLTNNATPTLTGTTEVGASVIISQGDIEIGSTTANDLGVWRFDIPATDMSGSPFVLQEGANIMTANVVDIAGNSGRSSQTITLDTTQPGVSTDIDGIFSSFVNDGLFNISGQAEVGTRVEISLSDIDQTMDIVNKDIIGVVDVNENGNWLFGFDPSLSSIELGNYQFNIIVIDDAGNLSNPVSQDIWIDPALDAPTITLATSSDSRPDIRGTDSLNTDGITNASEIVYTGTAEVGRIVMLYERGSITPINDEGIIVDADGNWEYTETRLNDEVVIIQAATVSMTEEGREIFSSRVDLEYEIDRTAPNDTLIINNAETTAILGSVPLEISGEGTEGNYIYLTITGNGATYSSADSLPSPVIVNNGTWTLSLESSVAVTGTDYTINVFEVDPAGNESEAVTRSLDVRQPLLEVVRDNSDGDGNDLNDNTPEFRLTLYDGVNTTGGLSVVISDIDTPLSNPTSTGIMVDNVIIGHLYIFGPVDLPDSSTYTATVVGVTGAQDISFTVDTIAPSVTIGLAPTSEGSIDNVAVDDTPEFTGTSEVNANIEIVIGNQTLTTIADANGNWSATSAILENDNYIATVTATDNSGNTSSIENYNFSVNYANLDELVLSEIQLQSFFPNITNDATPTFRGTGAQVGVEVVATLNNFEIGRSNVVDNNGNWTLIINENSFSIDADELTREEFQFHTEDTIGNTSNAINYDITFDTKPPEAPIITSVSENADGTFTIEGTATDYLAGSTTEKGSGIHTVTIFSSENGAGNTSYESGIVSEDGTWSVTGSVPTGRIDSDTYSFTAQTQDRAGNISSTSTNNNALNVSLSGDTNISPTINDVTSSIPTLTGYGESGDTIRISNGTDSLTAVVNNGGQWSSQVQSIVDENTETTLTITDTSANAVASTEFTLEYDDPLTA